MTFVETYDISIELQSKTYPSGDCLLISCEVLKKPFEVLVYSNQD